MINFNDVNAKSILSHNHWIGKLIRLPLYLIPEKAVLKIQQGPGKGLKWIVGSYNHGCWLGSYEFEKQKILPKIINKGDVIYDIGAHVGYFTIICAKITGNAGQVYAFEPFQYNISFIDRHCKLNNISNVEIINGGIASANGIVSFIDGNNSATGKKGPGERQYHVYNLVSYISSHALKVPSLIKMDIEGMEDEVVPSIIDYVVANEIKLLISTHSNAITDRMCSILASHNYHVKGLQWANQPVIRNTNNATLIVAVPEKMKDLVNE